MISYNLAKELKEAGFYQSGNGSALVLHNPKHFEDLEDQTVSVTPWYQHVLNPTEKHGPTLYAPTLSELIDACGEEFQALEKMEVGGWGAYVINAKDERNSLGKTPQEAVAKLYLALNNK